MICKSEWYAIGRGLMKMSSISELPIFGYVSYYRSVSKMTDLQTGWMVFCSWWWCWNFSHCHQIVKVFAHNCPLLYDCWNYFFRGNVSWILNTTTHFHLVLNALSSCISPVSNVWIREPNQDKEMFAGYFINNVYIWYLCNIKDNMLS